MFMRLFAPLFIYMALVATTASLNQAGAQSFYFRKYQVEQGLSNNTVLCVAQDHFGFTWFGSKDGLNRFDGYSFKIFRHESGNPYSLGGNFIQSLHVDAAGILWVGTDRGLYRYNAAMENFSSVTSSVAEAQDVREITHDALGNIWFIAANNLFQYHAASDSIHSFRYKTPADVTSVLLMKEKGREVVWVSTVNGLLCRYDSSSRRFHSYNMFSHSKAPVSAWIEKIADAGNGYIMVGTSNQGVKRFHSTSGTYMDMLTFNPDGTEIFARDFLFSPDGNCWIATESGIFIWNDHTGVQQRLFKKYNDPGSVSDNAIYKLFRDREGGIWACTYFGGINYFPEQYQRFDKYIPKAGENAISGNAVREIVPGNNGYLWIGTEDAGLNRFHPSTGKFASMRPEGGKTKISHSNIHGLLVDGNEVWVGTFEHGLDVLEENTGRLLRHYAFENKEGGLRSNFITCFYKTRNGRLLVGSSSGLQYFRKATDDFGYTEEIPPFHIKEIMEDRQGYWWLATLKNGLLRFHPGKKTVQHFEHTRNIGSIASNLVTSCFEDSHGRVWVATENGLSLFMATSGTFRNYTVKNGLPSDVIYRMEEDDGGALWISTSKGLVKFDPGSGNMETFTQANGLLNDQFNYNSSYKDSSGTLYFGSVKGFISFNPGSFRDDRFVPPVFITGIQVNNSELRIGIEKSPLEKSSILTEKISLNDNQSSFSINFAALSYTAPEVTQYRYMMEGLDKEWIPLRVNRRVYFTELAPGNYTFRIKAANSSGIWNEKETRLAITILPPFWASPLAWLFYTLAAAALIWVLVRNYHRRINERNRRRMEFLENEKEKEIYRAKIDFFTNVAHEIRTPLTLIKGPLEKVIGKGLYPDIASQLATMRRNTDRLIELSKQLLDFRQTEAGGFRLNFVRTNISLLLKEQFEAFRPMAEEKYIEYKLQLPEKPFSAYVDRDAFIKIVDNLLINALKYGERSAVLTLETEPAAEGKFRLIFENDGMLIHGENREKIFEPFVRLKSSSKLPGSGIGLALARSLTELHNGKLAMDHADAGLNVFVLELPVHQDIEFDFKKGKHESRTAARR